MKLKEAAAEFLEDRSSYCALKTLENYRFHLERFLDFAPEELLALDASIVRSYVIRMRVEGIRSVTINSYMRSVKVFCRWLYEEGYLEYNASRNVKLPRPDPKIKQPLSAEEVNLILRELYSPRDRLIFRLMLDAGLRESEVCNLKQTDIDLENNLLLIRNSKFNRNRIVPLCPRLKLWLQYYKSGGEYIVLDRHGNKLNPEAIKQIFYKLKKHTGITRVHAHLCRHTFATSYIMGGGNLEKLRVMLGHSDYNVTKTYLQLAAEYEIVKYPIYQLEPVFFETGYDTGKR